MFFNKKEKKEYDKSKVKPVIKASICNGEQVAGFKDLTAGTFEEVMLIKNDSDLNHFKRRYTRIRNKNVDIYYVHPSPGWHLTFLTEILDIPY